MGESDVFQGCTRAAQHSMAFGTTGRSEVTLWLSALSTVVSSSLPGRGRLYFRVGRTAADHSCGCNTAPRDNFSECSIGYTITRLVANALFSTS